MSRNLRTLSLEDKKAVDFVLNGATGKPLVMRLQSDVSPARVAAVSKLLHLLDEMPAIDPPKNLVAATMARIDGAVSVHAPRGEQRMDTSPALRHLH